MKKRAAICTMGCKVNTYESQAMRELLETAGYDIVEFDEPAEVYLINTCTVTQIAARKSRQMIHRARAMNPSAIVVAAGCYVDRDDSLIREGVIDLAVPNRKKNELLSYLDAYQRGALSACGKYLENESCPELAITGSEGMTRAFLKVQDGCRQYCSYCIIPYVRGPLTSRPIPECVREAAKLAEAGFHEIVLTGIHVSSYGRDLPPVAGEEPVDMGDLILAIAAIPQVERIRLSSLEPRLITPAFLTKVANTDKLCPHFHLSLQSGCNATLKAMNRKYTREEFREAVRLLREQYPDVAITTDVITGFPGETLEQHEDSLSFVKEIGFAEAHVFPYSKMEGTAAARRPDQIAPEEKKRRSREMLDVTAESSRAFMEAMQGKKVSLILEEKDESLGCFVGYTPNYMRVGIVMPEGTVAGQTTEAVICGYVHKRSANHDASGLDSILKGERL